MKIEKEQSTTLTAYFSSIQRVFSHMSEGILNTLGLIKIQKGPGRKNTRAMRKRPNKISSISKTFSERQKKN